MLMLSNASQNPLIMPYKSKLLNYIIIQNQIAVQKLKPLTYIAQGAGSIFNLEEKFRSWKCLFKLLWCKTSLNQAKNTSVNRVPSKIDFFAIDFTTGIPLDLS